MTTTNIAAGLSNPRLERPDADQPKAAAKGKRDDYYVASQWKLIWWKFRKHKLAIIASPILVVLYTCAIFADFLSPTIPDTRYTEYKWAPPNAIRFADENGLRAPYVQDMTRKTDPQTFKRTFAPDPEKKIPVYFFGKGETHMLLGLIPTDIHLFTSAGPVFILGTDQLGRDLFTRILHGSRISLSIGLVSVSITFFLGLMLGGIAGYFGGMIDNAIMRVIDLIVCIPQIPLWMALAAALPRDWSPLKMYMGMVLVLSMISWVGLARVVRGKLLSLRDEDFCTASRLAGASDMRVIVRHLLPSFASYIIVALTLSIPGTILGETALSFLGLGLQPPVVSWGVLLRDAQNLETIAHHDWLLAPIAWVVVTVLMFNFLGDGLRDAADPYK
ncbi:MAG: peptide/nickel transport system permease protein [Chloroflexota bacterium]|nr:peptide/nickel transport system permease protein [Chloroflexota bacterium]